ncbi:hypothetical protein D9M69_681470 [compost metagenome]
MVGLFRSLPDYQEQWRGEMAGDPLQGGADEQFGCVVVVPADNEQVCLAVACFLENLLCRTALAQ